MNQNYVAPSIDSSAFNCPHCNAFSQQNWTEFDGMFPFRYRNSIHSQRSPIDKTRIKMAVCQACKLGSIWLGGSMKFPSESSAPMPHQDMPPDIAQVFNEARYIVDISPRAATALLRLAVEALTEHLGAKEDDLNKNIGYLVKQGLHKHIQQALDSVRVIGNERIHPGHINDDDDKDIALKLFRIINYIVQVMITDHKEIDEIYLTQIPESKKKAIEERDKS